MILGLDNVAASYGETQVLFGVSLEVGRGEVVALLGANGAGKTTTLRSIPRNGKLSWILFKAKWTASRRFFP